MAKCAARIGGTFLVSCMVLASLSSCGLQQKSAQLGQPVASKQKVFEEPKVYKLEDLDHRSADHSTPDAIVYIAPYFDKTRPIHLMVYNHGMLTNLEDVENTWKLSKIVKDAPANTVVVAPEWAVNPHSISSDAGDFHKPGYFKGFLAEVFSKVPELKGKTVEKDVDEITLASFSGGLYVLCSELYKNGLEEKVKSVALFDSLYKSGVLDPWLKKNIKALASGDKQFYNFYFHTYPRSIKQAQLVQSLLKANKLNDKAVMKWDTDSPNAIMSADKIAKRPVVFKYCINGDEKLTGHNAVPMYYLPEFMKAWNLRKQGAMLANTKNPAQPI